ncbi:hypothetical protein [Clostridium felsineum]|uniref:hypothetical protein n=1 Tax=Clostridium felsineum TaxID=36839 RepID=UPI00098C0715|nr:hypothetical protein [Clostridium felsineum]URZ16889.1 hypothetical protein CLFE_029360 [Clostridium felsineum DSM 794]
MAKTTIGYLNEELTPEKAVEKQAVDLHEGLVHLINDTIQLLSNFDQTISGVDIAIHEDSKGNPVVTTKLHYKVG